MRRKKYLTPEQVNRLQGELKLRGHNTVTIAGHLQQPWGTVVGVINGSKRTPLVRRLLAEFLGLPEAELFGSEVEASPAETPAPPGGETPAPPEDCAARVKNPGHRGNEAEAQG